MAKQRFAFRAGFQSGDLDPNEVAAELDRVKRANAGVVSAESVVEAAKSPDSPLHAGFEWDDTEAAKLHRLNQARTLIRAVVIVQDNTPPRHVYVHVRQSDETTGGYYPVEVVVRTPDLFDRAADELRGKLNGASRSLNQLIEAAEAANRPKRQAAKVGKHLEAAIAAADGLR